MPEIRYHYQGRIFEADQAEQAGHALKIPDPEHPGRFHYVWPEQVIRDGVPAQDPYGVTRRGPTLSPERHLSTAPGGTPSARTARPASAGEITLAEVCQEAGIEPSLARRILRKNMPRPEGRWTFTPAERDAVINLLRSKK
jgi:hypothetical protein